LAGAYGPDDSAHQGEWACHSGRRPVPAVKRMAHSAAISRAVRVEDADMQATNHNKPVHGELVLTGSHAA